VIGLTPEVIIVMRTCDMDDMLHLQHINQTSLAQATTIKQLQHIKLELLCDELNKKQVLKHGIDLKTNVIPHVVEAQGYTWYIIPEGGAYVYDAWRTSNTFNPNIVLFVRHQERYGVVEGGSGRPTVLDHPLHIALFEENFRHYCLPHERFRAIGNR
jgi:hypothetical protein